MEYFQTDQPHTVKKTGRVNTTKTSFPLYTALIALVISVLISACGSTTPEGDNQTVVKEAWKKMMSQTDNNPLGKVDLDTQFSFKSPEASLEGQIDGDFSYDSSDISTAKAAFSGNITGDVKASEMNANINLNGDMMVIGQDLLVKLEELGLKTSNPLVDAYLSSAVTAFKNKWIQVSAPEQETAENPLPTNTDTLEANRKKIFSCFNDNPAIEFKSKKSDNQYEIALNRDNLFTCLETSYHLNTQELSETPEDSFEELKANLNSLLDNLEYSIVLKIESDYSISQTQADLSLKPNELTPFPSQITASINSSVDGDNTQGVIELSVGEEGSFRLEYENKYDYNSAISLSKPQEEIIQFNELMELNNSALPLF